MLKERESTRTIARQGEAIISLNNRITDLQDELKFYKDKYQDKQAVIEHLIEENSAMYSKINENRLEEIESEFLEILGNMKLLIKNKKTEELEQYINEQYEIIKKDLFVTDGQSHE